MLNSQLFKRKVVPRVPDQGRGRSKSKTKSKISNQRTPSVTIAGDIAVATSIDGLHDDRHDLPGASDAEGNTPANDDARGGYSDEIIRDLRQGAKSASGASDSPPSSPPRGMELRHKDSLRKGSAFRLGNLRGSAHLYKRRPFIISPNTSFRKVWDLVQAIFLFYLSFFVPLRVAYDIDVEGASYQFDFAVDMFFYLDLLLNFITGFENPEDHGNVITEPRLIAMNYARTWLLIDILGLIPVDLVTRLSEGRFSCSLSYQGCSDATVEGNNNAQLLRMFKLLRLFKLVKLLRLIKISKLFTRYQDDLFQLLPALSILRLLAILLFLGHIFGCFFFFFSVETFSDKPPHEQTWVIRHYGYDYYEAPVIHRYVASLYWAFTTFTTVGYGDIHARTTVERIFSIVGMIVGGFVFSGVVGSIGNVIQNLDLSKQAHKLKMQSVESYVKDHNLPKALRTKLLSFFRMQTVSAYDEGQLLAEIPMELRSLVVGYLYGDLLSQCEFLKGCSSSFMTELFCLVSPCKYVNGTTIYNKGEHADTLCVVLSGTAELVGSSGRVRDSVVASSGVTFATGGYFGESALVPPHRRGETIKAQTVCTIGLIEKEELEEVCSRYAADKFRILDRFTKRKLHLEELKQRLAPQVSLSDQGGTTASAIQRFKRGSVSMSLRQSLTMPRNFGSLLDAKGDPSGVAQGESRDDAAVMIDVGGVGVGSSGGGGEAPQGNGNKEASERARADSGESAPKTAAASVEGALGEKLDRLSDVLLDVQRRLMALETRLEK